MSTPSIPKRRSRPSLTRNADVLAPAYTTMTKAQQWGQALRDLRFLFEAAPPAVFRAATFTLGLHASNLRAGRGRPTGRA